MYGCLLNRNLYVHTNLIRDLEISPELYYNYLRMRKDSFEKLLGLVAPKMKFKTITAHQQLSAALRFLTTGTSITELSYTTRIKVDNLKTIILKV